MLKLQSELRQNCASSLQCILRTKLIDLKQVTEKDSQIPVCTGRSSCHCQDSRKWSWTPRIASYEFHFILEFTGLPVIFRKLNQFAIHLTTLLSLRILFSKGDLMSPGIVKFELTTGDSEKSCLVPGHEPRLWCRNRSVSIYQYRRQSHAHEVHSLSTCISVKTTECRHHRQGWMVLKRWILSVTRFSRGYGKWRVNLSRMWNLEMSRTDG